MRRWWNRLPYVPVYDWPLTDKHYPFLVDLELIRTYPLPPLKEWLG